MGLAIVVAPLADLLQNDPEGAEWVEREVTSINALLRADRLPEHTEPRTMPPDDSQASLVGFPYTFLHHLRRYAAWVWDGRDAPPPLAQGEDPTRDRVLDEAGYDVANHLICHSDAEGHYVPVRFEEVIAGDDIAGGLLGSSCVLLDECRELAEPLGVTFESDDPLVLVSAESVARIEADAEAGTDPYWVERAVWLSLYDAARRSVAYGVMVTFT